MTETNKIRVFLCHASQDKPMVRELYRRLLEENWINPWLDEEKLLPGQDWDLEIEKAVDASDAVIICLSNRSLTKEGYIQKELRNVLDIALEKPEGTIFIIPLRLDDCELPRRLRAWQYVNYFPAEQQNRAYQRLQQSLYMRFKQLQHSAVDKVEPEITPAANSKSSLGLQETAGRNIFDRIGVAFRSTGTGQVNIAGSVFLILYFAMAALDGLTPSDDVQETLLAVSAVLAAISLLLRRQLPAALVFKISLIVYLLIYGFDYRLDSLIPNGSSLAGLAAVIAGIVVALSVKLAWKPMFYSSISFAAFLFGVGTYEIATNFNYSTFTTTISTLILVTSIITSILLWRDL